MPVAVGDSRLLESAAGLTFSRTVDRAMLHRRNLTEVFLTDIRQVGDDGFVAAALLPVLHPHYTGHAGPGLDPMLLIECCRQAETYAAHAFFGVEMGEHFILRNWSADLRGTHPSKQTESLERSSDPAELVMTATTHDPRVSRGRIRGLEYEFGLWLAGRRIGSVAMVAGYVADDVYAVIRPGERAGPPPRSDHELPVAAGRPVTPARVGRTAFYDSVLLDASTGRDTATATLRVPVDNISFFDHPQDHVPGTVLLEAARQIATLATGAAPHLTTMAAMEGSYSRYAELDETITMTAVPGPDGAGVEVAFAQGGRDVARIRVVMTVAEPAPEQRG